MATAAMIIPTTAATLSMATTDFWAFVSLPLLPLLIFTADAAFALAVELLDPELELLPLDPELPLELPLDPPELLPELLELPPSLDG